MTRPRRTCPNPRCWKLQPCPDHPRIPYANAKRTGVIYYQTVRWKRESKAFLAEYPFCTAKTYKEAALLAGGGRPWTLCGDPATIVDHRIPHRGNYEAFWDRGNWSALCAPHHQVKTGRETRERVGAR